MWKIAILCTQLSWMSGSVTQEATPPAAIPVGAECFPLSRILGSPARLRPATGAAASRGAAADSARIVDLVLSPEGDVRWLVLSTGGPLDSAGSVLLAPPGVLEHEVVDGELRLALAATRAELERGPRLERGKGDDPGPFVHSLEAAEASSPAPELGACPAQSCRLASELIGLEVTAADGSFGHVSQATVDLAWPGVDYLLVSHGGAIGLGDTVYLVPFPALIPTTNGGRSSFALTQGVKYLEEKGVRYEKPPEGGFLATSLGARAHALFGTRPSPRRRLSISRWW